MRASSLVCGPRGGVGSSLEFAVPLRALCAGFDSLAVAGEGCDAPVSTGASLEGVWP